jgi:ABC-2 type transport system ATP-binding protein
MDALIEIRNLTKSFNSLKVVDTVSFSVDKGEVLGFLGPNGAGKSTTMKMITGFLPPTSGSVFIKGSNIEADAVIAKSNIGYLPEGAPAYAEMTSRDFLFFIAEARKIPYEKRTLQIQKVAKEIHLNSVMDQRIETLSKGFKRRLGLAQAILHDPEILILDEPTDGLDPNQKHEVRTLISEMSKDKAIIISTHILEEVEAVCSRAAIINQGSLVFDGTPSELASQSQYHNAVTVVLDKDGAAVAQKVLEETSFITEVGRETTENNVRLTLNTADSLAAHDSIREVLTDAGCDIREFYIERGRLDEVFRTLTNQGREAQLT